MMYKAILLLSFSIFFLNIQAQDNAAIGEWRSYLPHTTGKYVTQTPSEVWFADEKSIVIFNKEDNSTEFIDKTDGLSDVDVRVMKYSAEHNVIVVAYNNSNIDLVHAETRRVVNLNDIKRNLNIQGDKAIYDIFFSGDAAFFSTGFGIVKLNIPNQEFEFTTFTNVKINTFTEYGNHYYAASEEGVYFVPTTGLNLLDFSKWKKMGPEENLPVEYSTNVVYNHNNTLFLDVNDSLFTYQNNTLNYILSEPDYVVHFLQSGNDKLIINLLLPPYLRQHYYSLSDNGTLERTVDEFFVSGLGSSAVEDENNVLWLGDLGAHFKTYNHNDGSTEVFYFNSPTTVSSHSLEYVDDALWVAHGSIKANWNYSLNPAGFASYRDGYWTTFNQFNNPQLEELYDVLDVDVDEGNGTVYIASFIRGLYILEGENFDLYNWENSPLTNAQGDDPKNNRVPSIELDRDGILWMSNHNTPNPIVARTPDGNWKSFPFTSNQFLGKLTLDEVGNKWFTTSNNGLVIFNEGDDFNNDADNQVRWLNPTNSELTSEAVFDITMDLDSDMWVGTGDGIIIFECGANVFDNNCRGTKRIVERADGNLAHLLESETVRCITIDGANRKWCGTTNGVYLLSEDGTEEVLHFTEENSPLFDNDITDITINHKTGEVFIGTGSGILSYQGDATKGNQVHNNEVFAFPNPVRPDYEGPIAIRGLPQDAHVKITDISGTLVFETRANGGQAIWDGRDYNGRKANSGVYLVFSVNDNNLDNPDGQVTKILLMK